MAGQSATSPGRVRATFSREQALELKMAGLSYSAIGKELGCSKQFAQKLVSRAVKASAERSAALADELRGIEIARTESLIAAIWDRAHDALDEKPKKALGSGEFMVLDRDYDPQDKAIANIVKLMDRRAKLMGLDAPAKQELTGKDGGPLNGLPAALAVLSPPPSIDEVEHYIQVRGGAPNCQLETCRVHGKAAPTS